MLVPSPMAYQSEIEKLEARYRENPQQWFAALADSYRKAGDLELALEVVRGGLSQRPNYVSGHIVLGRCLLDQKNDPEAAQAFQRVLELDAENVIALKALAEISQRAGDVARTRRWLSRLLEVDPMNEEAQQALEALGPEVPPVVQEEPAVALEPEAAAPVAAETAPVAELEAPPPVELETASVAEPEAPPALELEAVSGVEPQAAAALEPETASILEPEAAPGVELEAAPVLELEVPAAGELEAVDVRPREGLERAGDLPLILPEEVEEPSVRPAAEPAGEEEVIEATPAEPVVTETMAEVYARQGLVAEARDIYRELVAQRPEDARLAGRLAELEGEASGQVGVASKAQIPLSQVTGGESVREFLSRILGSGVRGREVSSPPETSGEILGTPTRAAEDEISLAVLFGEEAAPPRPRPAERAGSSSSSFSFDEFFGPPSGGETKAKELNAPGGDEGDDFTRWLKSLKT